MRDDAVHMYFAGAIQPVLCDQRVQSVGGRKVLKVGGRFH